MVGGGGGSPAAAEHPDKIAARGLVLSLPAGVIYHRLLQRITACNGVPEEPTQPRRLGPDICVPYGKSHAGRHRAQHGDKDPAHGQGLMSWICPDTHRGLSGLPPAGASGAHHPAFALPAILVDDMLHDGKRIRRLAPLPRETGTEVKRCWWGISRARAGI